MARRFRKAFRRARSYFGKRRSHRSGKGVAGLSMTDIATVAIWGAARPYAVNSLSGVINMIPAGQYSDNVAMGGGAWAIGKAMPSAKKYTKGIILAEVFMAASKAMNGISAGSSTGSAIKVYS